MDSQTTEYSSIRYTIDSVIPTNTEAPITVRVGFGKGVSRIAKILFYKDISSISQDILNRMSVNEEPTLSFDVHGSSFNLTLYESIKLYEQIKKEVEYFGYKVLYRTNVAGTNSIATFHILEKSND